MYVHVFTLIGMCTTPVNKVYTHADTRMGFTENTTTSCLRAARGPVHTFYPSADFLDADTLHHALSLAPRSIMHITYARILRMHVVFLVAPASSK